MFDMIVFGLKVAVLSVGALIVAVAMSIGVAMLICYFDDK